MKYTAEILDGSNTPRRPNGIHEAVDEICNAFEKYSHESMRCSPPALHPRTKEVRFHNLYPDRHMTFVAVEHNYAHVARDENGVICGAALIWPDGHVKWMVLPPTDSHAVMEVMLDLFKDKTGISPWGQVETLQLLHHVLAHPKMTGNAKRIAWRENE